MSKGIVQLDHTNFKKEIEEFEGVALVDFWAPWCGPCRAIGPIIEQIADEFQGKVKIAKVNVDENNNLAMQFSIQFIPTFLLFTQGAVRESIVGQVSKSKLLDALERAAR